ncbi:hypothetical protein DSCW_56240 [Desulfosarcina widdelii]|uniref:Secretin/TonB short N-terminal domain-containing protein n=1 Tax=Desulfosarcina widdelii TaxID=947919 RepID=A0A5K7ZP69_9BACT|nr:hypothetical protein [Desulfosarcina widdelii]BBO78207.1 hypothetical protein DSCW_56240 [Desulfosarcina widdelii]
MGFFPCWSESLRNNFFSEFTQATRGALASGPANCGFIRKKIKPELPTHSGSPPVLSRWRPGSRVSWILRHWGRLSVFLSFLLFFQIAATGVVRCVQASSLNLRLNNNQRLLQIEARNVDLKEIFSKLAETAHITIEYPVSLQKKVTMKRSDISIADALKEMLKGINHVIFYSGTRSQKARISKVLVFNESEPRKPLSNREKRLARRIQSYRKQIDTLRLRLSSVDSGSSRGRRYSNRIRRLEKSIQRLQRQIY